MTPSGFQPLHRSEDGAASPLRTEIAITADPRRLVARFRSEYRVLTAAGELHDDELWRGDVVELFIAPDPDDRRTYFEIEVNPAGLVFDARVDSPELDRSTMRVDRSWNPRGLRVVSRVLPSREGALARGRVPELGAVDAGTAGGRPGSWLVRVALDWREILPAGAAVRPVAIGAYRIDRRSTASPLFLSLFPNLRTPPDFHTPRQFGVWDARADILSPGEPGRGT